MPYLTKSRFKLALECTAKLYYNDNKQYANKASEDSFLKELATGGFQVGALAQCYHPGGILIETKDHQAAFDQTLQLLQQENVTIFEAAFLYNNCFVRIDVLIKNGNNINLVEVKAKSFSKSKDGFYNKRQPGISSKWKPYLYDIAFQTWVAKQCLLNTEMVYLHITPWLMLADKEATTTVEGLNQRFFVNDKTREVLLIPELTTPKALGEKILTQIEISKEVQHLIEQPIDEVSFIEFVIKCSEAVKNNEMFWSDVGLKCKKCGFIATAENVLDGKLNGLHNCWKERAAFKDDDFNKPMAWEIWNHRSTKNWIEQKKYFIEQLQDSDLEPKSFNTKSKRNFTGFSPLERQEIQLKKTINKDFNPAVHVDALRQYFSEWNYPLHCIDFETTAVALPFHKGMHPYEQIAFQFSHHIIHENGSVVHHAEWINAEQGHFPNFDFVRALKNALQINGTIFRYAQHENTVLCQIHKQLQNSSEPDKEELLRFIESITTKKDKLKSKEVILWSGDRNMVDLLEVVKECWYCLYAKGSNSIKHILPAILNSSKFLQQKYSAPVYGTSIITSKNFNNKPWIIKENGLVVNPYNLLEPVFSKEEDALLDDLLSDEECGIYEGGAAMAAYGKMQFTHMTNNERENLIKALLRYCELDTLAMVMILEEFRELMK